MNKHHTNKPIFCVLGKYDCADDDDDDDSDEILYFECIFARKRKQ